MQAPIPEVAPLVGGDYVNGTGKKGTRLSSWMIGMTAGKYLFKNAISPQSVSPPNSIEKHEYWMKLYITLTRGYRKDSGSRVVSLPNFGRPTSARTVRTQGENCGSVCQSIAQRLREDLG